MKSLFIKSLLAFAFFSTIITSCKKDEADPLPGEVEIFMDNVVGTAPLALNTAYKNAAGEDLSFTTFNYFVSNFVFVKSDGTEYVVPQDSSYFLCKHNDLDSRTLKFKNIPAGDYTGVRFIIGVDSTRSTSDISQRQGVLDPAAGASGMYWAWNSGYIFVKVEGTSPQAPLDANTNERTFQYHTGLFGGMNTPTLNNIKTVTLSKSGQVANVGGSNVPEFHVLVNILEMFTNPSNISVATNPTSHAGPYSKTVADNYADMFTLDHIHN
jgi:hypothetical protein